MKSLLAALSVVATASLASAQPQRMDRTDLPRIEADPPQVILLTFGTGARIFEKFGHAAICLRHAGPAEPVCFNYGVTNFDAGSILVWNFLRGQQRFWVEPESWSAMLRFYEHEDRDIWMQPLPLAPEQARAIEARLYHDVQEEHRYYFYDHFYDNCTTRLRDMIDDATGHALRAGSEVAFPLTFRQIGRRGLATLPMLFGLADFVLGRQVDDTPSVWDAMFHPDVLRAQVETKLGVAPQRVYTRHGPPFPTVGGTFRLELVLLALVFALPLAVALWRRRLVRLALAWAAVWLGLWGVVIWTLVTISSIPGVRWNEAVLVFVPFDLALPVLGATRRQIYARVRVAMLLAVSLLVAIGVFHQPLWIPILSAFMPLAVVALGGSRAEVVSSASGGGDAQDMKQDAWHDQQQVP